MFEMQGVQSLLRLDPDLGQFLAPARHAEAERALQVRVASIRPGRWQPDRLCQLNRASNIGLLVLQGASMREVRLLGIPSAELLGPQDILRTWQAEPTLETLADATMWHALEPLSLAIMDGSTALTLRRYPEVMSVVLDRLHTRAERLATTQAISQITGVDTRIEAMLRHLSQRWGRVGTDGVTVGLTLSHRMIGALVGARRPTVSTALAALAAEGRVLRRADGTWLLPHAQAPAAPTVRLLTDEVCQVA
jgi:CRP/FNR family transcriptional regulator, cyclic AMP receptor protein